MGAINESMGVPPQQTHDVQKRADDARLNVRCLTSHELMGSSPVQQASCSHRQDKQNHVAALQL